MPSISGDPVEVDIDWHAVEQLFQTGEYDQIADLLEPSRWTGEGAAYPLLSPALAAVREISFACRQCHADVEWHRQAGVEAERREAQLKQNAQSILNWVRGQPIAEVQDTLQPPTPYPVGPLASAPPFRRLSWLHNLLQALRDMLVNEPAESAPEARDLPPMPEGVAEETVVAPAEAAGEAAVEQPSTTTAISAAPPPPQAEQATLLPAVTLMVYCFGPFRVFQHNHLLEAWNGLKGQAILKYLVAQRSVPVARDVLMDLFWSDVEPEAARRNLHQAIYSLRQTLRRRDPDVQHIQFENNQYFLNPELSVWLDVEEFEAQVQAGRRLEGSGQLDAAMREYAAAVNLYQGDFLAEDLYEDWPRPRRQQLRMHFLEIANRLSAYHQQRADYTAAISLCQQILSFDNCFEEAHRRLMQIFMAQGNRHLAIRQYHLCTQALAEELDVPPAEETRALYESITSRTGIG